MKINMNNDKKTNFVDQMVPEKKKKKIYSILYAESDRQKVINNASNLLYSMKRLDWLSKEIVT